MWLILLQILIIITGTSAKLLVGSTKYQWRRFGYALGIGTELLWVVLFYQIGLPIMMGQCGVYAIAWWTGLHRHPKKEMR